MNKTFGRIRTNDQAPWRQGIPGMAAILAVGLAASCRPAAVMEPTLAPGAPAPLVRDGLAQGAGLSSLAVSPRLIGQAPVPAFKVQYDVLDVAYLVVGIFEKGTHSSTVPSLGYFRDDGASATATNPLSPAAFTALQGALGSVATTSTADRSAERRYLFSVVRNPATVPSPVTLNNFPAVSATAPVHAYNLFAAAFDSYDNLIGYYEKDLTAAILAAGGEPLPVSLNHGGLATLTASASIRGSKLDPLEGLSGVLVGTFDAHAFPRLGWLTTDSGTQPFDGTQPWFPSLQRYIEAEVGVSDTITSDRRRFIIREFTSLATGDLEASFSNFPPGQHFRTFVMAIRNGTVNVGATVSPGFSVAGGGTADFGAGEFVTGRVDTFSGTGTPGAADLPAEFNEPQGLAVDSQNGLVIADTLNHEIRTVSAAGLVVTLAGGATPGLANGAGSLALFNGPRGVAVDAAGYIFVADTGNHLIRKVSPAGNASTLAGSEVASGSADGVPGVGQFTSPTGVALDATGDIYVADYGNNRIRKVNPTTGEITTLAGSGTADLIDLPGTSAAFNGPFGVAVEPDGDVLVSDYLNHAIRKITPAGVVSTLAGTGSPGFADGTGASATFSNPAGICLDAAGNLYIADRGNHSIRKMTPALVVTTLAGTNVLGFAEGTGTVARFNFPSGVAVDSAGVIYVADEDNHRIRRLR